MQLSTKSRRQIFLILMAMAVLTIGSAFAVVWMQQQISRTAKEGQSIEAQLAETTRKLRFLDQRIAGYHQPVALQGSVAGVLRPSVDDQVVFVREHESAQGRSYAVVQPYEVSGDLAFLTRRTNR